MQSFIDNGKLTFSGTLANPNQNLQVYQNTLTQRNVNQVGTTRYYNQTLPQQNIQHDYGYDKRKVQKVEQSHFVGMVNVATWRQKYKEKGKGEK